MGGPLACNQLIGVRLSANPLPRSSPEERPAYTRVAGGSIPSVAIGSLYVGGPRAGLKSRKTRFDSEGSHFCPWRVGLVVMSPLFQGGNREFESRTRYCAGVG